MPSAYTGQTAAAYDPSFLPRVRAAVIATATTVAAEGSSVTNHALRSALATRVLNYLSEDNACSWALAICSDGVTDQTATDAALSARCAALWNAFAGGL